MTSRRSKFSLFFLSWILTLELSYADASGIQVPFRLHRDHFIVVNGSIGALEDLNLVIDTGATRTVISKKIAKKLRLRGEVKNVIALGLKTKVHEVTIPSIRLGSLQFADMTVQVGQLSFVHGLRVDALIGLDLLKRTNLGIDYTTNTVTLGAISHTSSSMAFYNRLPFVMIRLKVGDQEVALMLDSGAGDELILFLDRVKGRFSWTGTDQTRTIRHLGGKTELRGVELSDVEMGESGWPKVKALLLEGKTAGYGNLDGILGTGALDFASLQVDFQNGMLSWSE